MSSVKMWGQLSFRQAFFFNACCVTAFSFPVFIFSGKTSQTIVTLESASQIRELELKEWEQKFEKARTACVLPRTLSVPCGWLSPSTVNLAMLFIWLGLASFYPHIPCLYLQSDWTKFCISGFLHSCTICPVDWTGAAYAVSLYMLVQAQRPSMSLWRSLFCIRLLLHSPDSWYPLSEYSKNSVSHRAVRTM